MNSQSQKFCLILCVLTNLVDANMIDVLTPYMKAPSDCKMGCADWTSYESSIWFAGDVPKDAKNSCAQPGLAVNDYTHGSWCRCKGNESESRADVTDDHPLNGSTFLLWNTYEGQDKYIGFAFTDAPSGEPTGTKGCNWCRATYASQTDGMPIVFEAVDGEQNTYTLFNNWGDSEFQRYLKVDPANTNFVSSCAMNKSDAMKVRVVNTSKDGSEVVLVEVVSNNYLSFTNDGQWIRADYTSMSDAMTLKLVPKGVQPSADWGYCESYSHVPEQINIQVAGANSVVIGWITFPENSSSTTVETTPYVRVGYSASDLDQVVNGVTHIHVTAAKDRTYLMHFVRLENLKPKTRYFYLVNGNASATSVSSDVFNFTSMTAPLTETVIDIYGDLGVYTWNAFEHLQRDIDSIDAIIHLGDHAYNEGDFDERRADGYMNAFQPIIANVPWVPVVGNHEFYSSAELNRYLDQTWETYGDIPDRENVTVSDTATSALGSFLSKGNFYAAAAQSNTSRYFSLDIGLVHFIALDLNMYYGVDNCGDACRRSQIEWLKKDLTEANENRKNVPWIVAGSHYPFYCTGCYAKQVSGEYYASAEAEIWGNANITASRLYEERANKSLSCVAEGSVQSIEDLVPVLNSNNVDLYVAGHWHYYESLFPMEYSNQGYGGKPLQQDFVHPNVTVHVTSGNGGPPGPDSFTEDCPGPDCGSIPSTRKQSTEYGFGRMTIYNSTHLKFDQISNADGSLVDTWMLIKES